MIYSISKESSNKTYNFTYLNYSIRILIVDVIDFLCNV
jgi:hypothetical protein